jgi:serine/threonine-protein phosphatase 5
MSNSEELKAKGNASMGTGHYAEAIEAYSAAMAIDATNIGIVLNRAQAFIKSEQYGAAIIDAAAAMQLDEKNAKCYHRRGVALLGLAKYKEALTDFRRVCELEPSDRAARQKFAEVQALYKKLMFEQAIAFEHRSVFEEIDVATMSLEASYDGVRFPDDLSTLTVDDVNALVLSFKNEKKFHRKYFYSLLIAMRDVLKKQPTLVDVAYADKLTVCGDVHGQFFDLANIFHLNGFPSETNPYLFNGDFVDRGSWSVECVTVLFAYKLALPNHFFLNRGNHESASMNRMYGFDDELRAKYDERAVQAFRELFCALPLAHLIQKRALVVHGGLFSTDETTVADIAKIDRFREPPEGGPMADLLWSDPAPPGMMGRSPSKRGVGVCFGADVAKRFLDANNLRLLIRSHEVKDNGYEIHADTDGRVITVFSAPNYVDQMGNKGAYIHLRGPDCEPTCHAFDAVPHPAVRPMAYSKFAGGFGM